MYNVESFLDLTNADQTDKQFDRSYSFFEGDQLIFAGDQNCLNNVYGRITYKYNDWPLFFFGVHQGIALEKVLLETRLGVLAHPDVTEPDLSIYICYKPFSTKYSNYTDNGIQIVTATNQALIIKVERNWYLKSLPAYDAADF